MFSKKEFLVTLDDAVYGECMADVIVSEDGYVYCETVKMVGKNCIELDSEETVDFDERNQDEIIEIIEDIHSSITENSTH